MVSPETVERVEASNLPFNTQLNDLLKDTRTSAKVAVACARPGIAGSINRAIMRRPELSVDDAQDEIRKLSSTAWILQIIKDMSEEPAVASEFGKHTSGFTVGSDYEGYSDYGPTGIMYSQDLSVEFVNEGAVQQREVCANKG
jgi:hypothetical protein